MAGCQPGAKGMNGYPSHWYDDEGKIPCPARDCGMLFTRNTIHRLGLHWINEDDAPITLQIKAEHSILHSMILQRKCPYCDFATPDHRKLFHHEETEHGSSNLSRLNGVVSLARQGNYYKKVHPIIFQRLVRNIWENSLLRNSLFRRATDMEGPIPVKGFVPMQPTPEFLPWILGPPHVYLPGEDPAYPMVSPQDFLKHLAPTDAYRLKDPIWEYRWDELRRRYASGEL